MSSPDERSEKKNSRKKSQKDTKSRFNKICVFCDFLRLLLFKCAGEDKPSPLRDNQNENLKDLTTFQAFLRVNKMKRFTA